MHADNTNASTPLEQSRHLATDLPGPKAQALAERQRASVSAGVGGTMATYAVRADRGVIEDVDGNRLIDLGSGIAVTTVGASHPKVVAAVQEAVANFTHTCFMVTPYEAYVEVAESSTSSPRSPAKPAPCCLIRVLKP